MLDKQLKKISANEALEKKERLEQKKQKLRDKYQFVEKIIKTTEK